MSLGVVDVDDGGAPAPEERRAGPAGSPGPERAVRLERWQGPWPPDDPDANFKVDVAAYAHLDPLSTITAMSGALDVPVGALCQYILARWACGGSEGLLELGPTALDRMWQACEEAEEQDTDEARLAAYATLRRMLSWLRAGLEPGVYGPDDGG